jgi:hypothetical protein
MHAYLTVLCTTLKARWKLLRQQPEAGYSTETVLVTALLVVLALAVIAVLVAKVAAKSKSIEL